MGTGAMTTNHQLSSDFSALIAIAQADELHGIREQILDRIDELGGRTAFELLQQLAARRLALAEERRRLAEEFDRVVPAAEGVEAPEERGDAWELEATDGSKT